MDVNQIRNVSLPALLLDIDALDRNCLAIARDAGNKKIRVATKSVRSIAVLKRILASHEAYQGVMTYTAFESIILAQQGFSDILIGYPSMDKTSLMKIARDYSNEITVMVDSVIHVQLLTELAKAVNGQFLVCIDIDMSTSILGFHFGVRRSPLCTQAQVLELVEMILASDHLIWKGVMGYEAQIAGVGDLVPHSQMKNRLIQFMKGKAKREIKQRRKEIVTSLQQKGYIPSLVNGGGTGSIHFTVSDEYVTEITIGSGFYSPLLFDYYHDVKYEPSLYFAVPIVRQAKENIYTCLGGGYIASGATERTKAPLPIYPDGVKLLKMEGAGEVQTPLTYSKEKLTLGSPIIFRAAKAGEICERFTEISCFSNNQPSFSLSTYRGEGLCFV